MLRCLEQLRSNSGHGYEAVGCFKRSKHHLKESQFRLSLIMPQTVNRANQCPYDYKIKANRTLGDFASNKNKISCENSDLLRIVGDLDNNLNILAKQKAALAAQLNDVKALCDNEARERGLLLG